MGQQLLVAQRPPPFVAGGHEYAEQIVGRRPPPLRDPPEQDAVQLLAQRPDAPQRREPPGVGVEEPEEQLAQPIDLRAGPQARQRLRRDVEGDPARLLVEIDLALVDPAARALGDDPVHDWQVAGHVGDREGGVHQLAVPRVLGPIHVEDTLAEVPPDDRRPPEVVAEVLAAGVQHEPVRLRPDQVDRVPREAWAPDNPEDWPVLLRHPRQPAGRLAPVVPADRHGRDRFERCGRDASAHAFPPLTCNLRPVVLLRSAPWL